MDNHITFKKRTEKYLFEFTITPMETYYDCTVQAAYLFDFKPYFILQQFDTIPNKYLVEPRNKYKPIDAANFLIIDNDLKLILNQLEFILESMRINSIDDYLNYVKNAANSHPIVEELLKRLDSGLKLTFSSIESITKDITLLMRKSV